MDDIATAMRAGIDEIQRLQAENARLRAPLTEGAQVGLPEFMEWIADRLVNVHDENPHVDYVLTLRDRAKKIRAALSDE